MAHTNSLPPSDRTETTDDPVKDSKDSKTFPCQTLIREKLRALRESSPIYSNGELGKKLGYSSAVLSQYLAEDGCKYHGNIAGLERKAEDFLQALERRRATGVDTSPAKLADELLAGFEYIRKTNDLGAIIADSGDGKTRGIELIRQKHSLAILVEATEWCRSIHDIMSALWTACAVDGWDKRSPRFPFLVQKMRGSDRPLIIDDAHKLSRDALSLLATFQEKTGCPVALVGLPELADKLADDPQRLSRTGLCWTVAPNPKDIALLRHIVRSVCKDINGELDDLLELCGQVSKGHGHKRTVHKVLKRASEIRHKNEDLSWCEAFRQAHALSLQPCQLT
jgi:DNA transposition AAA+ family ATPase